MAFRSSQNRNPHLCNTFQSYVHRALSFTSPLTPKIPMTSEAIGFFVDDPTSANFFWAAPALFTCALFDFFVSASKVYGVGSRCLVLVLACLYDFDVIACLPICHLFLCIHESM